MKKLGIVLLGIIMLCSPFCGCAQHPEEEQPQAICPLTGNIIAEDGIPLRPVAVDIDNATPCKPQYGVAQADIVYEIEAEYGITRLLCVYSDIAGVEQIGPVRSIRDYFIEIAAPLDPIYVSTGYTMRAWETVEQYDIDLLDGDVISELVWIDEDRVEQGYPLWQAKMTDGERIEMMMAQQGMRRESQADVTAFRFCDPQGEKILPVDGGAGRVYFHFRQPDEIREDYDGDFRYDETSGRYLKFQQQEPQVDAGNEQQMAFDNVFVLFGDIAGVDDTVLVKVEFEAGGIGYWFSGGRYTKIIWQKESFTQNTRLFDAETGEELTVNCGKSYVGIVNKNKAGMLKIGA